MKRIVILGGGTGGHLAAGEVDGTRNRLVSYDGREVAFDRAVVVPLHGGASYVDHSPRLGDEFGTCPACRARCHARAASSRSRSTDSSSAVRTI
ncbi:hypothetical protein AB0J40_08945 [Amycolatopsis sp. NPDC049691]|uniref:hypothetical protein n=1 Tax=Amycolatopsis sp. NPDC049691 TaxID=3155155 RepID=UPI003438D25F